MDLVSTNARTFSRPAEYGQSLVADLIALGAAVGGLFGTLVSLWALFTGRCRVHLRARHLTPDPAVLRRLDSEEDEYVRGVVLESLERLEAE